MKLSNPSCAVAFTRERNNATDTDSATGKATETAKNTRKPASLQELRTQLRAQLARNPSGDSATEMQPELRPSGKDLKSERQQEARRQKALAMLDADPSIKRAVHADTDGDEQNVILTVAIRDHKSEIVDALQHPRIATQAEADELALLIREVCFDWLPEDRSIALTVALGDVEDALICYRDLWQRMQTGEPHPYMKGKV